jgi:hypothetical protein
MVITAAKDICQHVLKYIWAILKSLQNANTTEQSPCSLH